ncbi:hypothetical protein E1091_01100 [Micromonospora fluostatini]|uniref:Minor tail protein n=1 Tax=Micromonospora fluostatini TaxID=1629071 RepID=A0ABY2DPT7_9ACTN|nr:hypothetical protein E1091_01100 [Micromonospora fluostatini]
MVSFSYPNPDYNDGEVVEGEYERLMAPLTPDGLIGHPSDDPPVFTNGVGTRVVRIIRSRRAYVRGFIYDSGGTDLEVTLAANTSGTTRVDLVVLRLDRSTWRVREAVITGTPGQGAPSPLDTSAYFDFPLAAVTVAHNASTLAAGATKLLAWYVRSDGQILCTGDTRPPHDQGRIVYETTTNRWLLSTGTRWRVQSEDTDWESLPLATGWSATINNLRRVDGVAYLLASPQRTGGNIGTGPVTLGNLPTGYHCSRVFEGLVNAPSSGDGRIVVNPSGLVQLVLYHGLEKNRFVNIHPLSWPVG